MMSNKLRRFLNKTLIWELIGLLSILIVSILLTYNRGMRGIDFHHMPLPADGGYRVFLGQIPFHDFHISMGLTVYYLQAMFFSFFGGFTWKAVALHAAAIGALATVIIFLILRLYLGGIASLSFAGIAALTFYMPRAYPWWDESALFFYLLALALFSFAYRYGNTLRIITIVGLAALAGLALTASIFTKHNIGFAALGFTAPLWLIVPLRDKDRFVDRIERFCACIFFSLLSLALLVIYFATQGDFFTNILSTSGQLHRLSLLLPNIAIKKWLQAPYGYGKIVVLVYISIITLIGGISYLLNLNLKKILRNQGIVWLIIFIMIVGYIANLTSGSGPYTILGLFSLLLGLLYALLSEIGHSYHSVKIDRRRFSNFCLIVGLEALLIILLWRLTFQDNKPSGESFLSLMLIIAVFFLAFGFIYRKFTKTFYIVAKKIFSGFKICVLLLALSSVFYYAKVNYFGKFHRSWQVLPRDNSVKLVEFKNIPALDGVWGEKKIVEAVEGIVSWFHPKFIESPTLKDGTEIYIFPQGQSLYGILGVESFRGVNLWLHYDVTFKQPDPDTNAIIKENPEYIIMYSADKDIYLPIPKLRELLQENYALAVKIGDFLIFQRVVNKGFK